MRAAHSALRMGTAILTSRTGFSRCSRSDIPRYRLRRRMLKLILKSVQSGKHTRELEEQSWPGRSGLRLPAESGPRVLHTQALKYLRRGHMPQVRRGLGD